MNALRGEQTPTFVQKDAPSPIRQAALDSAKAKTIAMQLEERVKTSGMKVCRGEELARVEVLQLSLSACRNS